MKIEIIKKISLTGHGAKVAGDELTLPENQAGTLIKMGFAKEVISEDNDEIVKDVVSDEAKEAKEVKTTRKRRTKAEIEADKIKDKA